MKASEIILNIAVNLGRLARWSQEDNSGRIKQFLAEIDEYCQKLKTAKVSSKFKPTLLAFEKDLMDLRSRQDEMSDVWAETALTWANILTHRAKLA